MTDGGSIQAELEAVEATYAEHDALTRRIASAGARLDVATAAVDRARRELDVESAEVSRLEGLSPTRILASLRGSREADLEAGRAEQQAAEYAVARAEADRAAIEADIADAEHRRSALGNLADRRDQALATREQWLRGHDSGLSVELDAIARGVGDLREQQREIREARAAAQEAESRLRTAREQLGSAQSWSTYDTFFGGGLITDMVKYDRIDDAGRLIRAADEALKKLGAELEDVGLQALEGVRVTELTRTFDVWFDNIFSDWAVRDRIQEAATRVDAATSAVTRVSQLLVDRERTTTTELERLARNREQLLTR